MFGVEIVYLGYIYYEERRSKTIYFGGGELNAKWGELIAFDTISRMLMFLTHKCHYA